jgi:hypothetical protein
MDVVRLNLTPQFLNNIMDLPPTAGVVAVSMTDIGTFQFSIAIEGDFPQNRQVAIAKNLAEIGAFIRDPYNEVFDPPKVDTRGFPPDPPDPQPEGPEG